MKYQLVIQWPAFSMEDYDAMIEIENVLIQNLSGSNEVDGHDMGTEEANIFIRTDDPEGAFDEIKNLLDDSTHWIDAKVAYREISKSEYHILWPKGLTKFKIA